LACATAGRAVAVERLDGPADGRLRPVARLTVAGGAPADPLRELVPARRTYRGAFLPIDDPQRISDLTAADDVVVVTAPAEIAAISRLNDEASLRTFRDAAYRAELLSWMRLSRRHPNWGLDGLNAEAMEMSPFEAAGAGVVLKPRVFELCDALGLAGALTAEAAVVRSAAAVVLFHRPRAEPPLETGRRFYRLWLQVTALGLSAAPMAVLADDPQACAVLADRHTWAEDRRLVTAFRLGRPPARAQGPKPRLPSDQLMV
jgi:nitroreductase